MLIKKLDVSVDILNMTGTIENMMEITKDNDYLEKGNGVKSLILNFEVGD